MLETNLDIETKTLTNREFLSKLYQYYMDGIVVKQEHPTLPLIIWNYTDKVQYDRLWDETLLYCRGLITDTRGNIIVKPFSKFFNFEEIEDKSIIPWKDSYVLVQEKIDGSLGILFNYNRQWIMSTRGSFVSDQAKRGMEIVMEQCNISKLDPNFNYLVEIVYPENRIVVEYGEQFVTFLSIFNHEKELSWNESKIFLNLLGINQKHIVDTIKLIKVDEQTIYDLKSQNLKNKEGYVFRFYPSNFRMKIKFEDYVNLHKTLSHLSTTLIWESLKDDKDIVTMLKDVPDEIFAHVADYAATLTNEFDKTARLVEDIFKELSKDIKDRKEFAIKVNTLPKRYHGILFKLFDNKTYDELIWKLIKPEFKKL